MRLDSSAGPVGDCEHETALNDQILLEICGASEDDPEVTPQWCTRLRRVPALMDEPCARRGHRLELALALLAAVLGRLKRYNPAHLPFGYSGPTIRSHNWVERDALERVGKQIAGLLWPTLSAETVAAAPWRVRRTVKFAARESSGRPERHLADFELRRQQAEMLEALGEIPDGTVVTVEVRHGLPLLIEIEQDFQAA